MQLRNDRGLVEYRSNADDYSSRAPNGSARSRTRNYRSPEPRAVSAYAETRVNRTNTRAIPPDMGVSSTRRMQVSGRIPASAEPIRSGSTRAGRASYDTRRQSVARDASAEPLRPSLQRPSVRTPRRRTPLPASYPNASPQFLGQGLSIEGFQNRLGGVGGVVRSVGEGVLDIVRTTQPLVLLSVLAAIVLFIWGMGHFFGFLGKEVYRPITPSYQSQSVINQANAPRTFAQDKVEPLVKAAQVRKQAAFDARLGEAMQAQKAYADSINLKDRDKAFKLGVSYPQNYAGSSDKVVYLTFDDGPSGVTQAVLDVLDRYNAKATFFVTNLMPEHKRLIKEAYNRGHTIGLHTSSHDYAYVYSAPENFYTDINEIAATVESQIGYVPCFLRFPGGTSNTISANYTTGIMTELSQSVQSQGFQYYDWNCENGDAKGSMTTEEILSYALSAEDEVDGTNLLMLLHDANDKQTTVEALPTIIEYYMERGYRFEAITPDSLVYQQQPLN